AGTDTEDEPAARDQIDARGLLGGMDRIALNEQGNPGEQFNRRGHRGRRRERDERVERVVVPRRQVATVRIRGLATHRDVAVLGDDERGEPPLFDRASQRYRVNGVVIDESGDPEPHSADATPARKPSKTTSATCSATSGL